LGKIPPPKGDPSFELKSLPDDLKYVYLDEKEYISCYYQC
jgi:hypothetical protein